MSNHQNLVVNQKTVEEVTQLSQVHFKLITPWVAVVSIRVHTFSVF
jgi:hypothetical protein